MSGDLERREFSRSPIKFDVEVHFEKGMITTDRTRDVSMNGIYLYTNGKYTLNTPCQMIIYLGERGPRPRIVVNGKISRVDDEGIAVEFAEVIGQESFLHLQRLVAYNSLDPDKAVEEFKKHFGIK
jgi:DNA-directed RNA polymerase subunit E'/Rpb7